MPNAAEQLSTGSKLARVSPTEAGISSRAVAALLEDARTRQLDLHDLLIYHRGVVGLELYKWPYRAAQPRIAAEPFLRHPSVNGAAERHREIGIVHGLGAMHDIADRKPGIVRIQHALL